jgi:ADP-heptose:LPS heptosyltransferase
MADTKAENLKKLARTTILINFIKKHNAQWNHEEWLELVKHIENKGYTPIDFDEVGVVLEQKKEAYLNKKK